MTADYLKLAREARVSFAKSKIHGHSEQYIPALCDAIEAQAAEIVRLQHRYTLLNNDLGETAEVCGRQAAEIDRLKAELRDAESAEESVRGAVGKQGW